MGQLTLYSADDEEDEITIEVSPGYDVLLDNLENDFDSREDMINDISRMVEATVYQQAQEQNQGHELHSAFAELLKILDKRGEANLKQLTENCIHQLNQSADQEEQ
jgi:hypothetical protein